MRPLRKSMMVLVACATATAAGFFGFDVVQQAQFAIAKDQVQATREQLSTVEDLSTVFRHVGKVMEPSVVNIQVRKTIHRTGLKRQQLPDDLLRRFFPDRNGDGQPDVPPGFDGDDQDQDQVQVGTGSGVVLEAKDGTGYILTNNHVAGGATEMTITLADGREITKAKVLGADPKSDLAVVEIKADRLIAAQWGDSDQLQKGDWVMAFGSPFGYVGSMTHGIVSALNRQAGILGNEGYENFIQVDAPINPGNSGGPLTNIHGEVVGINTAIATRSGGFQGIGFAIPSNQAKVIYQALKDKGKVVRGWLGVGLQDVSGDEALAKSYGYDGNKGVLVKESFANTPATGKLLPGDIITEIDGKPVDNVQQLRNAVAATAPGTEVAFKVFRETKTQNVAVKIGEQPEHMTALARGLNMPGAAAEATVESLGLRLSDLTGDLAQTYKLPDSAKAGAVVTNVASNSAAAKAGFAKGDLIVKINGQSVASAQDANDAIDKVDLKSKGLRFALINQQGSRIVFVAPTKE